MTLIRCLTLCIIVTSGSTSAFDKDGKLPDRWINGQDCQSEQKVQIHKYNKDFYILRQSVCTHFEAPFIYLIFGNKSVFMQDTGASDVGLVQIVDSIIVNWLKRNKKQNIQLVVSHSHGHSDHIYADNDFKKRKNTMVIGPSQKEVKSFFNLNDWPKSITTFDLGGRILSIIPLPGHQESHVAVYDPITQILLTGDSLYPGRLYFKQENFSEYKTSVKRLTDFADSTVVKWILGTHIEMTKQAGVDYPFETAKHLNERKLELNTDHLKQLNQGLSDLVVPVKKTVFADFILYPLN